jgi:DNA-binding CsgD family transcriptional regulator
MREIHFAPHESRVAWRLCHGLSNREIAYLCDVTEGSVKRYLFGMYKKFGVHNRLSFVLAYLNYRDMRPPQPITGPVEDCHLARQSVAFSIQR